MAVNKIKYIVLHCSDSKWGDREAIDRWHKERGFNCIGYHYVICNGFTRPDGIYRASWDGQIEIGRPLNQAGSHVFGHNRHSIGICLIGGEKKDNAQWVTYLQELSIYDLLDELLKKFPGAIVVGHNRLNPFKECPRFDVDRMLQRYEVNCVCQSRASAGSEGE